MWFYRSIQKIPWTELVSYMDVSKKQQQKKISAQNKEKTDNISWKYTEDSVLGEQDPHEVY